MLAAAQRLRRRDEFAATIRAGRRAGRGVVVVHLAVANTDTAPAPTGRADLPVGAGFVVSAVPDGPSVPGSDPPAPSSPVTVGSAPPARAGFVVPKTVGNAVTRNKVRRRLREIVRGRLADLGPGSDVVIRALPGAADRSFSELAADIDGALAAARTRRPRRRPGGSS